MTACLFLSATRKARDRIQAPRRRGVTGTIFRIISRPFGSGRPFHEGMCQVR